jgi:hypothetical protein
MGSAHQSCPQRGICLLRPGKTLFFQPEKPPSGPAYSLVWTPASSGGGSPSANFKKLHFSRAFTLARDITVTVVSFDTDTGKAITATSTVKGTGVQSGSAKVKPQKFIIDVPGLTVEQAKARADQLLKQYSRFERLIEVHMPGDPLLSFEQPIALSGTGTGWDGKYFADRIERELDMKGGFTQTIRAKNHPTGQTETTIPGAES